MWCCRVVIRLGRWLEKHVKCPNGRHMVCMLFNSFIHSSVLPHTICHKISMLPTPWVRRNIRPCTPCTQPIWQICRWHLCEGIRAQYSCFRFGTFRIRGCGKMSALRPAAVKNALDNRKHTHTKNFHPFHAMRSLVAGYAIYVSSVSVLHSALTGHGRHLRATNLLPNSKSNFSLDGIPLMRIKCALDFIQRYTHTHTRSLVYNAPVLSAFTIVSLANTRSNQHEIWTRKFHDTCLNMIFKWQ